MKKIMKKLFGEYLQEYKSEYYENAGIPQFSEIIDFNKDTVRNWLNCTVKVNNNSRKKLKSNLEAMHPDDDFEWVLTAPSIRTGQKPVNDGSGPGDKYDTDSQHMTRDDYRFLVNAIINIQGEMMKLKDQVAEYGKFSGQGQDKKNTSGQ